MDEPGSFRGVIHKRISPAQKGGSNTPKSGNSNSKWQFMRILFFLVLFIVFTVMIYQKTMSGLSMPNIHLNEYALLNRLIENRTFSEVRENFRENVAHKFEELTHLVGSTIDSATQGHEESVSSEGSKQLLWKTEALLGRVETTLKWVTSQTDEPSPLRWDLTSNADVHILHKLGTSLKKVLAHDNAEAYLSELVNKGFQCTDWQNDIQEIVSTKIRMDICSEVEWYKVVHLAWPEAKDFMDIGANKGYLGSLFLALWGGGNLEVAPVTIFNLATKLEAWKDSRNPAGYCKDGFNYGIPLFCDGSRDPATGRCKVHHPEVHITSIDGSSYLRDTLSGFINNEVSNKLARKQWRYVNYAMSNEKGTVRFTKQSKETNAGFEGGFIRKTDAPDTEEVNMTTVDLFMSENDMHRLDLLKIDTEGNDNKVIMGAKNAITNHVGMITFEGGKSVTFSKEMIADFDSLGFSCYSTSRAGLFKWNGGCMKEKYMGGFRAKDKGNIFCVNRQRAPMVTLAYDLLSFPMMIDEYLQRPDVAERQREKIKTPGAAVEVDEVVPIYVNIKAFCSPWPACAALK